MRLFIFTAIILSVFSCKFFQTDFSAKVVSIKDGDSIEVIDSNKNTFIVRLAHIDCPEYGQPFSKAAKNFTSDFCFNKAVILEQTDTDRYGRLVCEIFVEGESLNLALVKNGLAWHHTRYSDDIDFETAEEYARENKLGIWTQTDPIPPWEWRKENREK